MRDVTIDGKTFAVRHLKRSEVKMLRSEGMNLSNCTPEEFDRWLDRIFEVVMPDRVEEIDELPPKNVHLLFDAVMRETFGDKAEEKN